MSGIGGHIFSLMSKGTINDAQLQLLESSINKKVFV